VARAVVMAGQDVGGLGKVVVRHGVDHSQGQATQ
jgi:hypothetical protein